MDLGMLGLFQQFLPVLTFAVCLAIFAAGCL
jgi:hypothetical protein